MPQEDRSAAEPDRLARVAAAIRSAADPHGFIPFDRFQSLALYAPQIGYYTSAEERFGPGGDFYTAAHVSPLFGETIADRIAAEHRRLGGPSDFRVLELGAGDGALAAAVVPTLAELLPDGDWSYTLVDRAPDLRNRATARLKDLDGADRVRFAASLSSDGPFRGVVLANELLDALPAWRARYREGGWRELGVRWGTLGFEWAEAPLRPVPGAPLPVPVPEGTVAEVSDAIYPVLREVADHLVEGAALFLDYGSEEPDLLARGPAGTLQALRAHRTRSDPLEAPGSSDLSVFVNFTRVRSEARRAGLVEIAYGRQSEALARWGFEARRDRRIASAGSPEAEVRLRLAAKNLLFGFDSFRALELRAAGPT